MGDMYGREGSFPTLKQGNCPSQTCSCRSRTRNTDECEISRAKSDKFYLVLYVDKDHVDLKLAIEAYNLKAVYPVTVGFVSSVGSPLCTHALVLFLVSTFYYSF